MHPNDAWKYQNQEAAPQTLQEHIMCRIKTLEHHLSHMENYRKELEGLQKALEALNG